MYIAILHKEHRVMRDNLRVRVMHGRALPLGYGYDDGKSTARSLTFT